MIKQRTFCFLSWWAHVWQHPLFVSPSKRHTNTIVNLALTSDLLLSKLFVNMRLVSERDWLIYLFRGEIRATWPFLTFNPKCTTERVSIRTIRFKMDSRLKGVGTVGRETPKQITSRHRFVLSSGWIWNWSVGGRVSSRMKRFQADCSLRRVWIVERETSKYFYNLQQVCQLTVQTFPIYTRQNTF